MNKGLKALDEFRLLINNYEEKWDAHTTAFFRSCHDIIKKELENDSREHQDYREIKELASHYHWSDLAHDVFKVETDRKWQLKFEAAICDVQEDYRKARALDIIKTKRVNVHVLLDSNDVEEYNDSVYVCEGIEYELTQEEYELLKKALA